jgi:hypothetical protein
MAALVVAAVLALQELLEAQQILLQILATMAVLVDQLLQFSEVQVVEAVVQ